MGSVTTLNKHSGRPALINEMSAELQAIMNRVQTVEQQSAYLAEQISIHAQRHDFLSSALRESRKVADEISNSAEQRVNAVTARAQSIVAPQQEQITELNLQIAQLESQVAAQPSPASAPDVPAGFEITPLTTDVDNVIDLTAYLHSPQQHKTDAAAAMTGTEADPDSSDGGQPMPAEAAVEVDDAVVAGDSPSETTSQVQTESPICPSDGDAVETMNFNIEIRVYHTHSGAGWHRPKHRHQWKLQILVEVPEDTVDVVYIHVSAALTATLARFDDVLLNRMFPFDLIEPSHENMAAYFFNCLEDTLALKELILKEVVVVEDDTPQITVNTRSTDIEEMLKGEDLIQDIRASLLDKAKNGHVAADRPAKKKFGFFKRKQD